MCLWQPFYECCCKMKCTAFFLLISTTSGTAGYCVVGLEYGWEEKEMGNIWEGRKHNDDKTRWISTARTCIAVLILFLPPSIVILDLCQKIG